MQKIYLDYNALTPCDARVIEAMQSYWAQFGNPHSNHFFGYSKHQIITESLECLSNIYECLPEDIIFTSGATEANNLAIFSGILCAKKDNPYADTILTSDLEHKSVLEPLKQIAKQYQLNLIFVNITEQGQLDVEDFQQKVKQYDVLWVSVCAVNGEIGTVQPLTKISEICSLNNIYLHIDASQAGYEILSFSSLNADFLTISGHKIYAPSGIGVLLSKHFYRSEFKPMIYGGGQQNGLRSGTLAVPLIVGLTTACKILNEEREAERQYLINLRKKLLENLQKAVSIKIHGSLIERHPGNLHIAIDNINALQLLNHVQPYIAFSLGSACNGLNLEYSPILKRMGISKQESENSFRLCVGRMTTEAEIDNATQFMIERIHYLRDF